MDVAILSLLVILTASILIMKIAAVALIHTGLSGESARFQVRSAFMGVGYTTSETEKVVNHPVRRRIVMTLMLFGNAGLVSAMASVVVAFVRFDQNKFTWPYRVTIILSGIALLILLGNSVYVNRILKRFISWALERYTKLDVRDYQSLLHLSGDYQISELVVEDDSWMADKNLIELSLRDEGVLMIGIQRASGEFVGAPNGHTLIHPGDMVMLYAREKSLESLCRRRRDASGEVEHRRAVAQQIEIERIQSARDMSDKVEDEHDTL